ncbi:hypothetical protein BEL04_12635 [Mucilaginibacter sp. PPCGB 2223]|uniref:DUF4199 domain-containing protein n=1 Tax=Mucilaginibacter sp. PPCGB 2223 TaxID=1886027 RepID=UPI0008253166|nr:DUF4199 domain-containing protein [Mucilaginibacter sp. PPCGB 2223]OCX52316.1 hypothetical protein BEL04_12635 [Mucilaginibacter sp. PPCGB 2223]
MNKKYPWKQAIITGIAVGLVAVTTFSLGKQAHLNINAATLRGLTGLLTLVILGIGIYIGMQSIKTANSGNLTYGQAVFTGFIIAVVTGMITALVSVVYCTAVDPGYSAYMISESQKALLASGKSPADVTAATPALQQQWSTGGQVVQALVGQTICGVVIALVMGIFVKTKK